MHKKITFRHMEKSDALEKHAEKQLEKIVAFLANERSPIYIDLILEPSKVREHHRVELRVKTPSYDEISNYEHQGLEFYQVVDRVIDVMYKKLRKRKRERVDGKKRIARKEKFEKTN